MKIGQKFGKQSGKNREVFSVVADFIGSVTTRVWCFNTIEISMKYLEYWIAGFNTLFETRKLEQSKRLSCQNSAFLITHTARFEHTSDMIVKFRLCDNRDLFLINFERVFDLKSPTK